MTKILDYKMKKKIMKDLVNIEILANEINSNEIAEMAEASRQLWIVVENGIGVEDLKVARDKFNKKIYDALINVNIDLVKIDELALGLLDKGGN